jgi:hypothetical protein
MGISTTDKDPTLAVSQNGFLLESADDYAVSGKSSLLPIPPYVPLVFPPLYFVHFHPYLTDSQVAVEILE